MGGSAKQNKNADKVTCPICKKDHKPYLEKTGTNMRGAIAANTFLAIENNKFNKTNHLFYRKNNNKKIKEDLDKYKERLRATFKMNKPGVTDKTISKNISATVHEKREYFWKIGDPVQVHHLITVEAVDGTKKEPEKTDWYKMFYMYGYDINCAQNAVILPGDMIAACHFKVPLHKGGHDGTCISIKKNEMTISRSYVKLVRNEIRNIKTEYENKIKKCKKLELGEIKEFHNKMLEKTNKIFRKVRKFVWLITSDGSHYRGTSNIGCYDLCTSISGKRTVMKEATKRTQKKGESSQEYFQNLVMENLLEGGCREKKGRNHKDLGCENRKATNCMSEWRYNKPPNESELN